MTETERASRPAARRQMTDEQVQAYYIRIKRQKKTPEANYPYR